MENNSTSVLKDYDMKDNTMIESKTQAEIFDNVCKPDAEENSSVPKDSTELDIGEHMTGQKIQEIFDYIESRRVLPSHFEKLTNEEQRKYLKQLLSKILPNVPDSLLSTVAGARYPGDCGRHPDERPDWLDMDKFLKGQKFARDYYYGINYAQLLSLFVLFSFEHGLKPLIITDKSSTPYTSFKRYLSTGIRIRNWYTENPWEKGTAAYKDIQTVRKMHYLVKQKLNEISQEEFNKASKIKNVWCSAKDYLLEDLLGTCPAPKPNQCPYHTIGDYFEVNVKSMNQGEMSITQFGFMGLIILYPSAFGIHNVSDEDLDALCHVWRGIAYLLGVEDDCNYCNGTLEEIKQRSRDLLELWVKPNFRLITPEWEHMMRCMIEGVRYYYPSVSVNYEVSFLYLTQILNLHMPRLYKSLSYKQWFVYNLTKLFFKYIARLPGIPVLANKRLNARLDAALNFTASHHAKLEQRSNETLANNIKMMHAHT